VLERWRCSPDAIAAANPRAVLVRVSAFGGDGPRAGAGGNGTTSQAFAGTSAVTGEAEGAPQAGTLLLGDYMAAMAGVIGALLACYRRDNDRSGSGAGQCVDVAMYEPLLGLVATSASGWNPDRSAPMRMGNRIPGALLRNTYRTCDGCWISLSASTPAQLGRLLDEMPGVPEEDRARALSADGADAIDLLTARMLAALTAAEAFALLERARVPAQRVNDLADVYADPQVVARQSLLTLEDPRLGTVVLPAPSPRLAETPGALRYFNRPLDADRSTILADWLGISATARVAEAVPTS
jgi:crotonobetainyl-CoA:carnitine CoA-transferase CaiB-like acyl-CoA transferase